MKTSIAFIIAIIGWVALFLKLQLRIEMEDVATSESVLRYFSYFTILTNLMVTIYFSTIVLFKKRETVLHKPGTLTAITAFMTFVGLAYHILLRSLWNPTGLTMLLDETHHTLVPLVTIIFWYLYENKSAISFKKISIWILYPVLYLIWALVRGNISSFYPYYFLDVNNLGIQQVIINAFGLLAVIVLFLFIYFLIGKRIKTNTYRLNSNKK
ncbi:Pr6Pr family membrane protein [Algibacter sp. 2305UL17-15]|uniref:Pr6Pr family membrane protein n=1 Tax=Algibacter sp. 2305UL17-15 TaxID=3231268 RepID=UPI003458A57F